MVNKRDELTDMLAKVLAELLNAKEVEMPEAFLIYSDDMRRLITLQHLAQRKRRDLDKPRMDPELVDKTIEIVWQNSRSLTRSHMDTITEGLDLAEQKEKDQKASSTPEWINCY